MPDSATRRHGGFSVDKESAMECGMLDHLVSLSNVEFCFGAPVSCPCERVVNWYREVRVRVRDLVSVSLSSAGLECGAPSGC